MNALHMHERAGVYVDILALQDLFVNKYFVLWFGMLSFL